jgi:hypothetical protein
MKAMRATSICAAAATVALALPAVAAAKDRDHDRMPDRWEAKYGLNTHKNDARGDKDRDGLRNLAEYRAHTNPRKSDTDHDGIKDGNEQAGKIASFDQATSTLTINLAGGGTLSGKVNDGTEIECDDSSSMDDKTLARHGADDGPNHDQGDDHGDDGPNHDQNDDHGDDDNENCGVDALTAGRQVKEAEITGDGTSTIFEKVELGPTA